MDWSPLVVFLLVAAIAFAVGFVTGWYTRPARVVEREIPVLDKRLALRSTTTAIIAASGTADHHVHQWSPIPYLTDPATDTELFTCQVSGCNDRLKKPVGKARHTRGRSL